MQVAQDEDKRQQQRDVLPVEDNEEELELPFLSEEGAAEPSESTDSDDCPTPLPSSISLPLQTSNRSPLRPALKRVGSWSGFRRALDEQGFGCSGKEVQFDDAVFEGETWSSDDYPGR
jgi:hypothetical protein